MLNEIPWPKSKLKRKGFIQLTLHICNMKYFMCPLNDSVLFSDNWLSAEAEKERIGRKELKRAVGLGRSSRVRRQKHRVRKEERRLSRTKEGKRF